MKHQAREQWNEVQVPESVLARAREGAWNSLRRRRLFWIASVPASVSLALLVLLLWVGPILPPEKTTKARPPSTILAPEESATPSRGKNPPREDVVQAVPKPLEVAAPTQPRDIAVLPRETQTTGSEPKRLVMSFRLPRSGVQMIWIKDPGFKFGGMK